MESTYKTRLSSERLKSIVGKHLNAGMKDYREMSDGWANNAYVVTLDDDKRVVIKVAPSEGVKLMRCEENTMDAEVRALRLVAGLQDVPVPGVLAYDPSCSFIPAPYFIMEYVSGTPYNKAKDGCTEEERFSIERQMGAFNRRINEIKGDAFGYFAEGKRRCATWREAFLMLARDLLEDGKAKDVDLPVGYDELERLILAKADVLDDVKEPSLVAWDLWDGNVFVDQGNITAIIDFERSLWADPLMEHYFSHFNNTPGFIEGYGQAALTESEQTRRGLYDLYFDLVLWIECTYRQFENRSHIEWAKSNLAEGIDRFKSL